MACSIYNLNCDPHQGISSDCLWVYQTIPIGHHNDYRKFLQARQCIGKAADFVFKKRYFNIAKGLVGASHRNTALTLKGTNLFDVYFCHHF